VSRAVRSSVERSERLLRWYPRTWRERYGEEFGELLVADLDERPTSARRTVDIACRGLAARASVGGLGGSPVWSPQATLATVGIAMAAFVAGGMSLWSQLLVGLRVAPPDGRAVTVGVVVMSVGAIYLAVFAGLAAVPILGAVVGAARRGDARRLIVPAVVVLAGVIVLVAGGHLVQAASPGGGAHAWRFDRLLPGRVAGFGWAETLAISAYWAHPSDLMALPTGEVVWMLLSPVALATSLVGGAVVLRRIALSAAALAYEARLARWAVVGMIGYLAAASWWVVGSRTAGNDVFRAGSLDVVLIASMGLALAAAHTATRRISV
jgi:hypothetical protein